MKWTRTPFTISRSLPLWLACFCLATSPAVGSAQQLTPQDIETAFYNALLSFTEDTSGIAGVLPTLPLDLETYGDLGSLLSYNNQSVAIWAFASAAYLSGEYPGFYDFLRSLSSTNSAALQDYLDFYLMPMSGALTSIAQDQYDTLGAFQDLLRLLAPMSFTMSDELRVYDSDAVGYLAEIADYDSSLADTASDIQLSLASVGAAVDSLDTALGTFVQSYTLNVRDYTEQLQTISSNAATTASVLERGADDPDLLPTNSLAAAHTPIASITVPTVSTAPLQESLSLTTTGGDPVITLWEEVTLAGHTFEAGEIDLSSSSMASGVSMMQGIFTTLWWLFYYGALALLLRREFIYYTSLGSTEGAA